MEPVTPCGISENRGQSTLLVGRVGFFFCISIGIGLKYGIERGLTLTSLRPIAVHRGVWGGSRTKLLYRRRFVAVGCVCTESACVRTAGEIELFSGTSPTVPPRHPLRGLLTPPRRGLNLLYSRRAKPSIIRKRFIINSRLAHSEPSEFRRVASTAVNEI